MPSARCPEPREWLLKKKCAGPCGQTMPWVKFAPKRYWPNGSVRAVSSWCNSCNYERLKLRRADYIARNREAINAYHRVWRRQQRAAIAADRKGRGEHLPLEPFKQWLLGVREDEGLADLAKDASVHPDTLGKILTEDENGQPVKRFVSSKVAEAALCARGLRLDDIYHEEVAA